MKISTSIGRAKRLTLALGIAGATVGMGLLAAAPAQAGVGSQPGHVTMTPATGSLTDTTIPTWQTDSACPTGFTDSAVLDAYTLSGTEVSFVSQFVQGVTAPFGGSLQGTLGQFVDLGVLNTNTTYELVVHCNDPVGNFQSVQSMYLTLGATDWQTSPTPPASNATPTTTALTATPNSAAPGDAVALDATVTANSGSTTPVGNVQFVDGATPLGSPVAVNASGAASSSITSLGCGTHSIIAKFAPTDPNAFAASTSSAVTVTINGAACALSGTETVNVAIPNTGAFTFTVDGTPVSLGTATANGNNLEATGQLSPVTVSDTRNTVPGWSVAGQTSDFSDGTHTIDGNSLGWTPAITTPNAANDVTAGTAIAPGSNPGLKQGGDLASAAATKGSGTTVLGGGLDLVVPASTNAGSYSATVTLTAIDTAS